MVIDHQHANGLWCTFNAHLYRVPIPGGESY
jgi:hypothetical protein